ncbi:MAG: hypothetical protein IT291_10075 [Deltaproteobacteria bacterium]|nr:hypothetical protein [Deltaproteobacteria bacterium]
MVERNSIHYGKLFSAAVALVLSLCMGTRHEAFAEDRALFSVPIALEPWVDWVKERHPEWNCAKNGGVFHCVWPGVLQYELTNHGARFALKVELQSKEAVILPSRQGIYPLAIDVINEKGERVEPSLDVRNDFVYAILPAGVFDISGELLWDKLPPEIPLPESYALVSVDKTSLPGNIEIKRQRDRLWVEEAQHGKEETIGESIKIAVMRRIRDGSPMQVDTLLKLRVSGKRRPLDLGKVTPLNSLPVAISCALPHYLSSDGNLALQLNSGEYEVNILSVIAQPAGEILLPTASSTLWPTEETIAFVENTAFRTVEVSGALAVHASATELPPSWMAGAVYAPSSGSKLTFKELRRGILKPEPNELDLQKEIWVDLDNGGYTAMDTFSGSMHQGFRLNALAGTKLGRASVNGVSRLVSRDANSGLWGVELRDSNVQLQAVSRYENGSQLSAVGWDTKVANYSAWLHLPPSWLLFAVHGADTKGSAWVESWSLLELFLCFLVTLTSFRLFGSAAAIVVGLCSVLNHDEFLAPQMLYIHLLFLVVWRSVLSDEKSPWHYACRILLSVTFLALVIQSLAFAKLQFTQFLFPQLQSGTRHRSFMQDLFAGIEMTPLIWPAILFFAGILLAWIISMVRAKDIRSRVAKTVLYGFLFFASMPAVGLLITFRLSSDVYSRSDYYRAKSIESPGYGRAANLGSAASSFGPMERSLSASLSSGGAEMESDSDVVQDEDDEARAKKDSSEKGLSLTSGPAIPTWHWRRHNIVAAGPILPQHQLSILLIPASVMRFICGVRTVLILVLMFLLLKRIWSRPAELVVSLASKFSAKAALVTALLLLGTVSPTKADFPGDSMLSELERRFEENLCKNDVCAVIEVAKIELSSEEFKLSLKVASDGQSVVTAPGPLEVLPVQKVLLNGKDYVALRRSSDGFLEVRTNAGLNDIEITGPLPQTSAFSLEFPARPLVVHVESPKWFVEGLSASGFVAGGLRFTAKDREEEVNASEKSLVKQKEKLLSWAVVRRFIAITTEDVKIETHVERLGELAVEDTLKVPLFASERVLSGNVKVEGQYVYLGFASGAKSARYSSALGRDVMPLVLQASAERGISEEWQVSCSVNIHCEVSGLNPSGTLANGQARWSWLPFPSEEAKVSAFSLETAQGDTLTIDNLNHDVKWGTRLLTGKLQLEVRATQTNALNITLPEESEVENISVDNVSGANIQNGSSNQVLLSPGTHVVEVSYQQPFSVAFFQKVPGLLLDREANNVNVSVSPNGERWILWAGGASWGPCVVYWAKLIVVVLICVGLASAGILSIGLVDAILLGIGLTTLPVIYLWIPLLWLGLTVAMTKQKVFFRQLGVTIRIACFIAIAFLSLVMFYEVVRVGLVLQPPMLIVGNGSAYNYLKWYVDRTSGELLRPWILSVPLYYWRIFSLLWAMWLVVRLIAWLKTSVVLVKDEIAVARSTEKVG